MGFLLGILIYDYINFSESKNYGELFSSGFLGILIAYIVHYSNLPISTLFPWKKQPGLRLLAGIFVHLLIALSIVFGLLWIYGKIYGPISFFIEDPNDVLVKIAILIFCTALIYNIIYFAFYSYYEYSTGQVLEIKLKRKQIQLQLDALKSQLGPHFLFNSINTLSSLFHEDTQRAESFIRSLAGSYEYVLNKYEAPLVRVFEELSFVESYCFLMRTRFGDHLNLQVRFSPEVLQSKVPPLTLQMLVENAVKHNVIGPHQKLEVQMTEENKKLIVSNNKTAKRQKSESLNIGLKNISSRYELLVNKSVEIIDNDEFKVVLPLIP